MAVIQLLDACSMPMLPDCKRSHPDMHGTSSIPSAKWIDEEIYRSKVLSLCPLGSESETDEQLDRDAQELGLSPAQEPLDSSANASNLSATTVASDHQRASILSQSTTPTSCASSERRPSTSLSNRSSRINGFGEMSSIVSELERKRHSGFKDGLRKMTGFRKKRSSGSSTPSISSMKSQVTGTTIHERTRIPLQSVASFRSGVSHSSHEPPMVKDKFENAMVVDEDALQRSLQCEELLTLRAQQLEEKRRFLEYQTNLVRKVLDEREQQKAAKREIYSRRILEQEERDERAVEELESRQLEDELKQMKEHESEKRAIHMRLKHMEAYCHTPTPSNSSLLANIGSRPSIDSVTTLPERHVTPQHYENLAQAYHARDNMDALHASKINVLRGKQKRALQSFVLKREREIEQLEKDRDRELDSIDVDVARQEAEVRQEFGIKRTKLEARWKLQALVKKAKLEQSTGLKYEGLPDIDALEA